MKNKLLFKIIRFLRKLGIKPDDIKLELQDEKSMGELAQTLFGAILNLPELEDEYYEIVSQLFECTTEEAEDKEVFEIVPHFIKSLKGSMAFSSGVLKSTNE